MDKCEKHPHCYVSDKTPCPGCVSQAALDAIRVPTPGEAAILRYNASLQDSLNETEGELFEEQIRSTLYKWAAILGWACLVIYSAFGGPEV